MDDVGLYTMGHPEYFETLGRVPIQSAYLDQLRACLPKEWTIVRSDIWLQAKGPASIAPLQGFKIHLSCSLVAAAEMIQRFAPICARDMVQFKIAADPVMHGFLNSKRYYRGGSGKFATIYPPDHRSFLELAEALHQATKGMDGPYILSDKRYLDSKVVFYRWGGFQRLYSLRPDGTKHSMVKSPDGTLVPDERLPYFKLPEWAEDPFPEGAPEPGDNDALLHDRYKVVQALSFSNTGGVYLADDEVTGLRVVIKEARPHTLIWGPKKAALDARAALMHESTTLQRLQGLPCVPEWVDFYQEWEHTFLVQTWFNGIPLANFRALEGVAILDKVDDPEAVVRFCVLWRQICLQALAALDAIHSRGVIVGDISPGNVLVNRESRKIVLIDFESAFLSDSSEEVMRLGSQWFNPGFRRAENRGSQPLSHADDSYACGMLLYNLVCPIQSLFELDRSQPLFRILDYFVDTGLPGEIRSVIRALVDGHVEDAYRQVESWNLPESVRAETAGAALS